MTDPRRQFFLCLLLLRSGCSELKILQLVTPASAIMFPALVGERRSASSSVVWMSAPCMISLKAFVIASRTAV